MFSGNTLNIPVSIETPVIETPVIETPVSVVNDPLFSGRQVCVQMLRLDQLDPVLNGNKPFKLAGNLEMASRAGFDTILSFGGAYSNHIHALAEAGRRSGIKTVAVVRGDDEADHSHTLEFAQSCGMKIIRVSRQDYRRRNDSDYIQELEALLGPFYLVPEGGANVVGMQGCMQLADIIRNSIPQVPHEILLACGTGATLAGLVAGLAGSAGPSPAPIVSLIRDVPQIRGVPLVRGVAVLKGADFLKQDIARFLGELVPGSEAGTVQPANWELETQYHWGGYARFPAELRQFVDDFERQQRILLDPVYTAKLLSAVYQRVQEGCYAPGTRLLVLHTGGLQGRSPLMAVR